MKTKELASFPQVRVGSVAEQIRGVSYSKDDARSQPSQGFVPVLRANNVSDEGLVLKDFVFIPHQGVQSRQLLRKGDILVVASSGSLDIVGRAAMVQEDMDAGFGAFCKVVRPNSNVESRYLAHFFRTSEYRRTISNLAGGANINNLRGEHIDDLALPLPPLTEQKRLAAILDQADAIRRKRQQALRLIDDFLHSVFLDHFGDSVSNPKGWPSVSLSELVGGTFRNGLSPSNSGKIEGKVLTLTAITTGKFDSGYSKDCHFDRPPSLNQTLDEKTFLICRGNGNKRLVGIGLYSKDSDPTVSFPDTMIGCTPSASEVTPEYLESIWTSTLVRRQIEEGARTTNGTFKVNQQVLGAIRFPLPSLATQQHYAQISRAALRLKAKLASQTTEAESLFQSIQNRAFTGQL